MKKEDGVHDSKTYGTRALLFTQGNLLTYYTVYLVNRKTYSSRIPVSKYASNADGSALTEL